MQGWLGLVHVNLIFGDSHVRPAPDPNAQIKGPMQLADEECICVPFELEWRYYERRIEKGQRWGRL